MSVATDEATRAFEQAKTMLTAASLQVPMNTPEDTGGFVTMSGISLLAYGLWSLTYELKDMAKELAEVKSLVARQRLPGR